MPRHWETTRPFFLSPLPAAASRWCSLPAGCFPCRRLLRFPLSTVFHGAPARQHPHPTPAAPPQRPGRQPAHRCPSCCSLSAPLQLLPIGALAGNKPHPAEKSTPVWLAIWRTWAGFANSQLLPDAAALSSMQGLPRSGNSSAQTSASLHPPAALRLRCLPFTRERALKKGNVSQVIDNTIFGTT